MGYCYNAKTGALVCDICGDSGGVRKRPCPFGWCPPCAACPSCKEKHADKFGKDYHRKHGCEKASLEYAARNKRKQDRLDAGEFINCSALSTPEDAVHVLFQNKVGECLGFYMSHETYDQREGIEPYSPDDFRKWGELIPAPNEFAYGNTTKQVAAV